MIVTIVTRSPDCLGNRFAAYLPGEASTAGPLFPTFDEAANFAAYLRQQAANIALHLN